MRLYVIGGEGQVSRALREAAALRPGIELGWGSRPDVELLRPKSIEKALAEFRPDVVVNPAAYTAVDKAELEPDVAFAINRDGAHAVAAAAATRNIPIIHFSTDYVFDGAKQAPYSENDSTCPKCVYGQSKLEGENAVAAANPHHVILRTSWVYAPFGTNFVRTILRLMSERDHLRIVDDQIGCPTYAPDIATTTIAIAEMISSGPWRSEFEGITHLAGPDALTWYAFAERISSGASQRGLRSVPIKPITTSEYPTPAARPANSRLSSAKLADLFGIRLPPLDESLSDCLQRLLTA